MSDELMAAFIDGDLELEEIDTWSPRAPPAEAAA